MLNQSKEISFLIKNEPIAPKIIKKLNLFFDTLN